MSGYTTILTMLFFNLNKIGSCLAITSSTAISKLQSSDWKGFKPRILMLDGLRTIDIVFPQRWLSLNLLYFVGFVVTFFDWTIVYSGLK